VKKRKRYASKSRFSGIDVSSVTQAAPLRFVCAFQANLTSLRLKRDSTVKDDASTDSGQDCFVLGFIRTSILIHSTGVTYDKGSMVYRVIQQSGLEQLRHVS
jgi:hypothetical protein